MMEYTDEELMEFLSEKLLSLDSIDTNDFFYHEYNNYERVRDGVHVNSKGGFLSTHVVVENGDVSYRFGIYSFKPAVEDISAEKFIETLDRFTLDGVLAMISAMKML